MRSFVIAWTPLGAWRILCAALIVFAPLAAQAQVGSSPGETRDFGGIPFVWCPPGSVMLGSDSTPEEIAEKLGGLPEWYSDEGPARRVDIEQGFWISQHPITVENWVRIGRSADLEAPAGAAGSDRPVTGVTMSEIRAFVQALEDSARGVFRLPSEAEWEYACRAGSESLFPFGDDPEELGEYAWYRANSPESVVQPVGQKRPNAWGLHDMLGNAWEVCRTPYAVAGSHADDTSVSNFVIRGGSVKSPAGFTRSAYRAGRNLERGHPLVGFRVLREPGR